MTEQEKAEMIANLQMTVNGTVSALVLLRKVSIQMGSYDAYPMFEDITIKSLLDTYEELQKNRGY